LRAGAGGGLTAPADRAGNLSGEKRPGAMATSSAPDGKPPDDTFLVGLYDDRTKPLMYVGSVVIRPAKKMSCRGFPSGALDLLARGLARGGAGAGAGGDLVAPPAGAGGYRELDS
jgi:hypothetical protein